MSGIETARKQYSLPKKEVEDVSFDLVEIDHVAFGEPFDVTVHIQVSNHVVIIFYTIYFSRSILFTISILTT